MMGDFGHPSCRWFLPACSVVVVVVVAVSLLWKPSQIFCPLNDFTLQGTAELSPGAAAAGSSKQQSWPELIWSKPNGLNF